MKRFFLLLLALSPLGTTTSLQAQLVHLAIQGTVTEKFGGGAWWTGSGVGAPALLDVFYDAKPVTLSATPTPENNYWRLRFGQLDASAPISSIAWENTSLFVETLVQGSLTTLNLELKFTAPSPADPLPAPPFPPLAPRSPAGGLTGYTSTVDFDTRSLGGLGAGSLVIGVDSFRAELLTGSVPVPEASTFGYGAGLVLVCLVTMRRRKAPKGVPSPRE